MKLLVVLLGGGMALAQTAPPSYTITEMHSFAGPPGESLVVSRSGSKAAIGGTHSLSPKTIKASWPRRAARL